MRKVEDFNNTWCYATEANYDALVMIVKDTHMTKQERMEEYKDDILFITDNTLDNGNIAFSEGLEEITLINGEFYYVIEKIKDNDLICKCGAINGFNQEDGLIKCKFCGYELYDQDYYENNRDVLLSKKEWYEKEENIGKLLTNGTKVISFDKEYFDNWDGNLLGLGFRPLKENEVISLIIEEK